MKKLYLNIEHITACFKQSLQNWECSKCIKGEQISPEEFGKMTLDELMQYGNMKITCKKEQVSTVAKHAQPVNKNLN